MLMLSHRARERRRPAGFIVPCAPTMRETAPSGPQWIHEIKHDDMRLVALKEGERGRRRRGGWISGCVCQAGHTRRRVAFDKQKMSPLGGWNRPNIPPRI
jgi:hypothetical protein